MKPVIAFGLLVGLLWTPAGLAAQAQDDARLAEVVAAEIREYTRLTIFEAVTAHVSGGAVTLQGKVTQAEKKGELAARVRTLAGVRSVRDEIQLLASSRGDDELRTRTARAIYGNPAFWRYAALPHPPIRILVEHGHVTLAGLVPTETERALAQSLASGHGARSLSNRLRVEVASR